jgi:hypothetical protein
MCRVFFRRKSVPINKEKTHREVDFLVILYIIAVCPKHIHLKTENEKGHMDSLFEKRHNQVRMCYSAGGLKGEPNSPPHNIKSPL